MNKQAVLNELVRDMEGTRKAWDAVSAQIVFGLTKEQEKALADKANGLREQLVGLHDRYNTVKAR